MISYLNEMTRNLLTFPINMNLVGMQELADQFYKDSLQLEFFPERKKRGLAPGYELINELAATKQKIMNLHNENSPIQIDLDKYDIVISPGSTKILSYGDRDSIESMSRILIHNRYLGTRKCWVKK